MIVLRQGKVSFRLVCKETLNNSSFSSWFDEASLHGPGPACVLGMLRSRVAPDKTFSNEMCRFRSVLANELKVISRILELELIVQDLSDRVDSSVEVPSSNSCNQFSYRTAKLSEVLSLALCISATLAENLGKARSDDHPFARPTSSCSVVRRFARKQRAKLGAS